MQHAKLFDAVGRLAISGDRYVPVNPSNRYNDVVWGKLYTPKPPRTYEDPEGKVRDFAWVTFESARDGCTPRLVWKEPSEEVYRLWDRPLRFV